jgi:hypothetical protein
MGVYFELMTVIRGIIYFSSPVKILSLQEYSSFFLSFFIKYHLLSDSGIFVVHRKFSPLWFYV